MPKAAKPKRERKHSVRASLKVHELTKAGTALHIEIFARDEKIGELEIGRGALYWRGGKRKLPPKRMSWTEFAERMDALTYGER